jgi:hypothetical protein
MNQVLTQGEINSLLRGLSDGGIEEDSVAVQEVNTGYRRFDITNQERIILTSTLFSFNIL